MTGLSALGMSTAAATAMAQSLSPVSAAPPNGVRNAMRDVQGTGGALFVAQLKAAGVKYVFFNPSTGDYPIFDALVDEPASRSSKVFTKAPWSPWRTAMRAPPASRGGRDRSPMWVLAPNAMTPDDQQLERTRFRCWLRSPRPTGSDRENHRESAIRLQEVEFHETMTHPITKWTWMAKTTAVFRRP